MAGIVPFIFTFSCRTPASGTFCGSLQLIVFRSGERGIVWRTGLHIILLKEPVVPMIAVVRIRRMGGMVGSNHFLTFIL